MNIKDLREQLIDTLTDLKGGKLTNKEAKEIANLSGKIISSAKTELDYNKFMNKKRKIEFLEVDGEIVPSKPMKEGDKTVSEIKKEVRNKK